MRRASLRATGAKRSRAVFSLQAFPVRRVAQCLMLFPQDAELQRAGCERLTRALIDASHGPSPASALSALITEMRSAFLLPVVINAMEVHASTAHVLTASARLLGCLANIEATLRANIVAAGALPAISAALRAHSGAPEVHALCDLAAEIVSARGAPPGSRRSMCDALAATGGLRAVLRAMRGHVKHEGIVGAACKVRASSSSALPMGLTTPALRTPSRPRLRPGLLHPRPL